MYFKPPPLHFCVSFTERKACVSHALNTLAALHVEAFHRTSFIPASLLSTLLSPVVKLLISWLSHLPNLRCVPRYSCLCLLCLYSSWTLKSEVIIGSSPHPCPYPLVSEQFLQNHAQNTPPTSPVSIPTSIACAGLAICLLGRGTLFLFLFLVSAWPSGPFSCPVLYFRSSSYSPRTISSFVLTLSPYNSQGDLFLNMRDPFLHQDLLKLMAMSPNPLPCLASPTHCCFMLLPGALTATSCYLSALLL